jgi:pyruvate kinase
VSGLRTRRAKIVATIGPATREPDKLRALLDAGVDVFRLNFAHGSLEEHETTCKAIRQEASATGRAVGVLVDLPGPKMRTGPLAAGAVELVGGSSIVLSSENVSGDATRVGTTVADLSHLVHEGEEIHLADGEIVLRVDTIEKDAVRCTVLRGGTLRSRKGLHIPAAERQLEAFTEEDRVALDAAVAMGVDLVGLSFVRDAEDLDRARSALPKRARRPQLVAKIETASAVEHLSEVVRAADAVMVARGDLGIQTPLPRVPLLQKRIIKVSNEIGRPVITATEMLESMTDTPLPTRAEVTDVANAVLDGADALMLSEETAVGLYPVESVVTMSSIIEETQGKGGKPLVEHNIEAHEDRVSWAVAHAAVQAAEDLNVAAILCVTATGSTPRRVAMYRPEVPVVGLSALEEGLGALALVWGVTPVLIPGVPPRAREIGEEVDRAVTVGVDADLVKEGDLVVVVAGSPGPRAGATDYLRIVRV